MPGSHSTYIYDAIARHGGIETVLCRNEQAGGYMADGYARVAGRPGVICTTAGPGATNTLSAVAEAYADSVPVLLIAGQVSHDRIHEECGRYHEMDLEGIFTPCTRFAGTVMENGQIPGMVDRAMEAMVGGRPGPAALFLPQDLMAMPGEVAREVTLRELKRVMPGGEAIRQAREMLQGSQRPVIVAGGGAMWSDAGRAIEELARKLDCPVISTLNGKGVIDERAPFAMGHGRCRRARVALSRADVMLAIGCRFTEVFTASGTLPIPKQLIQIDIDPKQIGVNYPVAVGVVGDARVVVEGILSELPDQKRPWREAWEKFRTAEQLKPEWLIETLRAAIPDDAIVVADASEMGLRMQTDFPAYSQRTFFYPSNYASLGWGFPASVGAAVGAAGRIVVSMNGDGGFLMSAQELAIAARYRLKLIVVIHNDSTYGAIKAIQRAKHESRFVDTDLNNPDFMRLAEAFEVPSCRASDATTFASAMREAITRDGPSLIEMPDEWRSLRV